MDMQPLNPHALVILGPTALKIGYVMRLLAQRQITLAM